MIRVLGRNRGELALLCRRLFLGHRDISFDRHAVLVVPRLGLAGCAIKLELSMKGRGCRPRVVSGSAATFTAIRAGSGGFKNYFDRLGISVQACSFPPDTVNCDC